MISKSNSNGNKNISIKEYFESKFIELKNYMDVKFENIEKSTRFAQDNLNTRLEGMNEFRNSMKDQATQYITRAEHDALITKIDSDVRYLREATAEAKGKATQQSVSIAYIISFIGLLVAVVSLVIKFI